MLLRRNLGEKDVANVRAFSEKNYLCKSKKDHLSEVLPYNHTYI
jgi:hypothetical protein